MRAYSKQSAHSPSLGCIACTSEASAKLFDALSEATGEPHGILHALQKTSRSIEKFRKTVDALAKKRGVTIDWNKPLPTAQPAEQPPPAPPATSTAPPESP